MSTVSCRLINMSIYTTTDTDGDTLNIEEYGPGQWIIEVSGEDGHRQVLLSEDDIARLTEALAQITPIHRG